MPPHDPGPADPRRLWTGRPSAGLDFVFHNPFRFHYNGVRVDPSRQKPESRKKEMERQTRGTVEVVTLSGDISAASALQIADQLDALVASAFHRLVLEMAAVRFIDSSGLSMLAPGAPGQVTVPSRPRLSLGKVTHLTDFPILG